MDRSAEYGAKLLVMVFFAVAASWMARDNSLIHGGLVGMAVSAAYSLGKSRMKGE